HFRKRMRLASRLALGGNSLLFRHVSENPDDVSVAPCFFANVRDGNADCPITGISIHRIFLLGETLIPRHSLGHLQEGSRQTGSQVRLAVVTQRQQLPRLWIDDFDLSVPAS